MPSYNKALIMGNLVRDPELRYTPAGKAVCEISVAVNKTWKGDDGERREKVVYIGVVFWGKTAENVAKYFTKGKPIFVEGEITQDLWDDKETGKKREKTKIQGESFQFVGGDRTQNEEAPQRPERPPQSPTEENPDDDDIPF